MKAWVCCTCNDEADYSYKGKKYCVGHWNYGEPQLLPANIKKEQEALDDKRGA